MTVCLRNYLYSDPAVKQLLVNMDETQHFIIPDLDDNHLLIKADEEDRVRKELDAELERNTYSLDT
ncbi:TFIIH subunit TTDA/Tfb5 [Gautieria morchelliformis]|nr:TFIIH subunit TTDA/Tfb5 [Gautieria morchelliformis]